MITIQDKRFIIENDSIRRELVFAAGSGLKTISFFNKETGREYAKENPGAEFLVKLNGQDLFGYNVAQAHVLDGNIQKNSLTLDFVKADAVQNNRRDILSIVMRIRENGILLSCNYEVLENLPGMAKWIEIHAAEAGVRIEKFIFEAYNVYPGDLPDILFYTPKDSHPRPKCFVSDPDDDIVQAHNHDLDEGLFLCNDAPGPLNSFMVYPVWTDTALCAGYNAATVPFAKVLKPHECFRSNKAYSLFYKGGQNTVAVQSRLRSFLRDAALPQYIRDDFMFCTWIPFLKNININLVTELIGSAQELGMSTFVLDDGWFADDAWKVDEQKFPNGLEEVSKAVQNAGMRFGLWFNIGTSYGNRNNSSEDSSMDATGELKSHAGYFSTDDVKCLASNYVDFLTEKLKELAARYQVGYFKLDFSSIISPYGLLRTGCAATNHKYHEDLYDSVYEQYAALGRLRDSLHEWFPNLIIDFSFETFGDARPSIAALQFSGLHHSTNLNTAREEVITARDIRNTLYQFNKVLPTERILGSLICLQGKKATENFLTSLLGAPLVSGDIRLLTLTQKKQIALITKRIRKITAAGPLSELEILRGDRPVHRKDWDGFSRYQSNGRGIACLFQNEYGHREIIFSLSGLPSGEKVHLKNMLTDEMVVRCSSEELRQGVAVRFPETEKFFILEIS